MVRYGFFSSRNWSGAFSVLLWVSTAIWAPSASAQFAESLTAEEVALLPEYCRHTSSIGKRFGSSEGGRHWTARLGKDFMHLHHYCWALAAIRRSEKVGERNNRSQLLKGAIADCTYVINAAHPTFVVLPDVFVARGIAHSRLGQSKEANADFQTAQKLAPTHVVTYVRWAGALVSQGLKAEAKSVVEEGLRHIPDSPALQRLAQDLSKR